MTVIDKNSDIRKFSLPELEEQLITLGEPKYRARQIYEWLWQKSAAHFEDMSSLSKSLRTGLNDKFAINQATLDKYQKSFDGTIKARITLFDGNKIESVLIPVPSENRFTVCVSTQVGCSLTCSFCATGRLGRIRNLDAAEIYDQVVLVNKLSMEHFGHPLTNIVYMGMGEPLLNYKEVMRSIELITSPTGLNMSPRRITVSTAGIAKMIMKMADDGTKVSLALSLHAANDIKRSEIMPINEQNNLQKLIDALQYFYQKTKNNITFEYIALKGFNDSLEDAAQLARWCKKLPVKVNIIEYNPIDEGIFDKSEENVMDKFAIYLKTQNVQVTVRRSRGKDIDAACGQLANKD